MNFEFKRFGDNFTYFCNRSKAAARVSCGGAALGMIMDTEHLRFMSHYLFGYLDGDNSNKDTPVITIGTCTKMR